MLEALYKSAQTQVTERLASPLMGSFLISWPLWNWKFVIALLSKNTVTETIRLVETVIYPHWWSFPLWGVLLPLLTAAVYIFGYPYPARFAYRFSYQHQKKINDDRLAIEELKLLSLAESRAIRNDLARLANEHDVEIDKKNKEIDELSARLRELLNEPKELVTVGGKPKLTQDAMTSEVRAREALLAQKVDSDSLRHYTQWKFPSLPISLEWNDRAVRDLDPDTYPTLAHVDAALDRADEAVSLYAREKPEWFKNGTDYVTKSLGFVDPSFRSRHGFAPETLEAIGRLSSRVRPK